jgi:serine/threonine-protein kinase RsbW
LNVDDQDQQTLMDEVVTINNLVELRTHVLRLAARAGLNTDRADEFTLAVSEAVSNAIQHAGGRGELAVVKDDQSRLIAEISDEGPGIPCAVTVRLPAGDATGGRGLWLVQTLADHVEVRTSDGGTTVRLEMSLPPPRDPDD